MGADIVKRALCYPLKLIASNAGDNGSVVMQRVLESDSPHFGYNAATGQFEDLMASGIIDPAKVWGAVGWGEGGGGGAVWVGVWAGVEGMDVEGQGLRILRQAGSRLPANQESSSRWGPPHPAHPAAVANRCRCCCR